MPFETLQQAFGPESLGILVVKDVPPQFAELRRRALSYSSYLGNLPKSELGKQSTKLVQIMYRAARTVFDGRAGGSRFDCGADTYHSVSGFFPDPRFPKDETERRLTS